MHVLVEKEVPMLNPFIQSPSQDRQVKDLEISEEMAAQRRARLVSKASGPKPVALWAGKLLIRMGEKLTQRDFELKSTKEHA